MVCSRSWPSRADGVVRAAPGEGRGFVPCREHRARRPVGPFGAAELPPVSDQGHRSFRIDARARSRDRQAREPVVARRRWQPSPRPTGLVLEQPGQSLDLTLSLEPLPAGAGAGIDGGRTARAALASLAAHTHRPPPGRPRR